MPRSRPTSSPVSYHKHTNQYYVTRGGKRIYLGSDRDQALRRYHEIGLGGTVRSSQSSTPRVDLTAKELANRFLAAQRANWRNPQGTLKSYKDWIGRFLKDHRRLRVAEFTVERFASWKLSLKERVYSAESINHYLSVVRAMFRFAEEMGLMDNVPRLKRVRNEPKRRVGSPEKPIYSGADVRKMVSAADVQLRAMVMLALNCGFGPKDIHDLTWQDLEGERVTLPRSKTGVCQTYELLLPRCSHPFSVIRPKRTQDLPARTVLTSMSLQPVSLSRIRFCVPAVTLPIYENTISRGSYSCRAMWSRNLRSFLARRGLSARSASCRRTFIVWPAMKASRRSRKPGISSMPRAGV